MTDVILDFFRSEAIKNHVVLFITLLVLSFVLGCLAAGFIINKLYIPWKKKQIQDYKQSIIDLKQENERLAKEYDTLKNEYIKLRKCNQESALKVDYEDYQNEHLDDSALEAFLKT